MPKKRSSANQKARNKALIDKYLREVLMMELKNPKIGVPFVNEVIVTEDYQLAKVFVSFYGNKYPKQSFEELLRCKGAVRTLLAKKLNLYKCPDIMFIYDDQFDKGDAIDRLLEKEAEDIENAKKGMN
ncbi:MAG: 30S ribosome-binding factor RbfA [Bacilli bacterium]|nr:30S ribosome-binding factor RbfA [Bacilli bacterium]